jgi:hypothetical protein
MLDLVSLGEDVANPFLVNIKGENCLTIAIEKDNLNMMKIVTGIQIKSLELLR